jgi:1,4-dihydroxy-6-naphthoate synthase
MFDALIHEKIDTMGLRFEVELLDVEELNKKAEKQYFDVTKLSYHAMVYLLRHYQLLNSGSALGSGVGPLLIAKTELSEEEVNQGVIAIPGKHTTANFLLSLAYPNAGNKKEMLFSAIEAAVLEGEVTAGLIIHENRFTYQEKGLVKLIDLGNFWEQQSGSLIPLGGIVCRRNFDEPLKQKIDLLVRKSIEYAFQNRSSSEAFVKRHAQEMKESVIQQHIDLYVNQYSIDLGTEGRAAVAELFQQAKEKELVKEIKEPILIGL